MHLYGRPIIDLLRTFMEANYLSKMHLYGRPITQLLYISWRLIICLICSCMDGQLSIYYAISFKYAFVWTANYTIIMHFMEANYLSNMHLYGRPIIDLLRTFMEANYMSNMHLYGRPITQLLCISWRLIICLICICMDGQLLIYYALSCRLIICQICICMDDQLHNYYAFHGG